MAPASRPLLLLLAFSLLSTARSKSDADPCPALPDRSRSCTINCFRADPVCGVNGVTYWCGCPDAACAGVRVARRGACHVGNGAVSGQAFLLLHILWLIVLGFSVLFGLL